MIERRTLLATVTVTIALAMSVCVGVPTATAANKNAGKKLVVIGATARSGREIIRQALDAGYTVTGLARSPQKFKMEHERLTLLSGDVRDVASLEAALDGDEVVICMVGYPTPKDPMQEIGPVDLYTTMAENLIGAMKAKGSRRLIVASSTGVEHRITGDSPEGDSPTDRWRWNARFLYADMAQMERMIADSGLEYVTLRPGFMVEEPARNDILTSTNGNTPPARVITYADFAQFVLAQVEPGPFDNMAVGIFSDTIMDPAAELKKYQERLRRQLEQKK